MHFGIVLAAVARGIALQAFPLPYAWVSWLSPGVDPLLREYELGYRRRSATACRSNRPRRSSMLFLRPWSGAAAGRRDPNRSPVHLEWLVSQLMGLAVALAVVGVVPRAFFDPARSTGVRLLAASRRGEPFGPFVNRNHFAGWMVMVLPMVAMYTVGVLSEARRPAAVARRRGCDGSRRRMATGCC